MESETAPSSGGVDPAEHLETSRRERLLELLSSTSSQQPPLPQETSPAGDVRQATGSSQHVLLSPQVTASSRMAQLAQLGSSRSYMNALANPTAAAIGPSEDELLTRLLLSRVQASNRQQLLNDLLRTTPITDLDDDTLYRLRARQGALSSFRSPLHVGGAGLYGQANLGVLGPTLPLGGASALSREQLYHAEHSMSRNMLSAFPYADVGRSAIASRHLKRDRDGAEASTVEDGTQQKDKKKQKKNPKKKPADMPRRPLSAYNLFFSEERERILREMSDEGDNAPPGNEAGSDSEKKEGSISASTEDKRDEPSSSDVTDEVECRALKRPLVRDNSKRRPHRKTHGKIGFKSLAQMVGQRWRSLPSEKLSYYQKLAEEDTKRQKMAMEEYYKKKNSKSGVGASQQAEGDEKGS